MSTAVADNHDGGLVLDMVGENHVVHQALLHGMGERTEQLD
jgi:hypothetical protein